MKIQTNSSGSRSIEISEDHLQTIEKYQLFRDLIDSNGYVDEQVLDKLKLNVRALLEAQAGLAHSNVAKWSVSRQRVTT